MICSMSDLNSQSCHLVKAPLLWHMPYYSTHEVVLFAIIIVAVIVIKIIIIMIISLILVIQIHHGRLFIHSLAISKYHQVTSGPRPQPA